jgi:hypothetical protein
VLVRDLFDAFPPEIDRVARLVMRLDEGIERRERSKSAVSTSSSSIFPSVSYSTD